MLRDEPRRKTDVGAILTKAHKSLHLHIPLILLYYINKLLSITVMQRNKEGVEGERKQEPGGNAVRFRNSLEAVVPRGGLRRPALVELVWLECLHSLTTTDPSATPQLRWRNTHVVSFVSQLNCSSSTFFFFFFKKKRVIMRRKKERKKSSGTSWSKLSCAVICTPEWMLTTTVIYISNTKKKKKEIPPVDSSFLPSNTYSRTNTIFLTRTLHIIIHWHHFW